MNLVYRGISPSAKLLKLNPRNLMFAHSTSWPTDEHTSISHSVSQTLTFPPGRPDDDVIDDTF